MDRKRDVFHAIADPTRREIIEIVSRGAVNVNAIAEHFSITRQAVSLQVKILEECGLIRITHQGRERVCVTDLEQLDQVTSWIGRYRAYLDDKMNALDDYLDTLQKQKIHGGKK